MWGLIIQIKWGFSSGYKDLIDVIISVFGFCLETGAALPLMANPDLISTGFYTFLDSEPLTHLIISNKETSLAAGGAPLLGLIRAATGIRISRRELFLVMLLPKNPGGIFLGLASVGSTLQECVKTAKYQLIHISLPEPDY